MDGYIITVVYHGCVKEGGGGSAVSVKLVGMCTL